MTPNQDKLTITVHRRVFASSAPQDKVTVSCHMVFPWFRIPSTSLHSLFMAQQWHRWGRPFHQLKLTPFHFGLLPFSIYRRTYAPEPVSTSIIHLLNHCSVISLSKVHPGGWSSPKNQKPISEMKTSNQAIYFGPALQNSNGIVPFVPCLQVSCMYDSFWNSQAK